MKPELMETSMVAKINAILGEESELIALKGKFFSPAEVAKKDGGEIYYTFKLRVPKGINEDKYNQSYNSYYLIMPAEISNRYTKDEITNFKNNEVIVLCTPRAGTRSFKSKQTGDDITVNDITLFCS
ncbi:MAG: hypothetical protein HGA22_14150 [Clostridiales bacterium]|nr:hypothetical protein [Clostridiales bacterium]